MQINFSKNYLKGSVIIFAYDKTTLSKSAKDFDKKTKGALAKAIKFSKFDGNVGEIVSIASPSGIDASRLICVGLGEKKSITKSVLEKIGAMTTKALLGTKETEINIFGDDIKDFNHFGFGMILGAYQFENYKTEKSKNTFKKATFIVANPVKAKNDFKKLEAIATGIYTTRNLVSEPPNVLTPDEFSKRAKNIMTKLGAKVEIYNETKLKQKKMNLILSVAQASDNRPALTIIHYNGAKNKTEAPTVLVGKGLCFDSGGLCIKPGTGMLTMKQDMAGGATVLGTMQAIAMQKAPINVIGIIPMVENSIAGNAYRPDDVITSYSGKTVEIINTDAEGRLVLADALWLAQEFKPKAIIDLATLTGAIKMALGSEYAGLFTNDESLAKKLIAAGKDTNEKLWQFPMDKAYDDLLKSDIADFRNLGKGGAAGSITAACFLQRFIKPNTKWAHLDIAGVAYVEDKSKPISPSNATGFGVYLLNSLLLNKA